MSEIDKKIEKALLKATKRGTHKRYQTGCVLVKNGEVISDGCSHSSSLRLNSLESIHAEIHALARGRHKNLNGAVAYVCTIARKSGNYVYSAPCLTCAIALRTAGINEVIFTNGDNHPVKMQYNEMLIEGELKHLKVYSRRVS